jgi:hypothetical protein
MMIVSIFSSRITFRKFLILFSILFALGIISILVLILSIPKVSVSANGGSYSITFTAADAKPNNGPYDPTYKKYSPSGLACPSDPVIMDPLQDAVYASPISPFAIDSVTSLAPADMALGQIVPFEIIIDVGGSTSPENGVIQFTSGWNTKTTSNDDFGYDKNFGVYCAFIDQGDSYYLDPVNKASVDWVSSTLVGDEIQGQFQISGLDDQDHIVLEVWMVLDSIIPQNATGNVQSRMISAFTVADPQDTIQTGNQTIPLNKIGEFYRATADLQISKIDVPNEPMMPLDQFLYVISVWNTSIDTTSNGVIITDTLDNYVQFISYQIDDPGGFGRFCVPPLVNPGGLVTCDLKALSPGEVVPITMTVSILETAPIGSSIETPDCVYGDHSKYDLCNLVEVIPTVTQDDNSANNSDTEPKDVSPIGDLGLLLECPGPVISDPMQHCKVYVTNHGPHDVFSVVMTDTLPSNTTFITYTSNLTSTMFNAGNDLVFNLLDEPLVVDQTWEVDMLWDMTDVISTTVITVTNTAVVTASTPEPVSASYPNFDSCTITPLTITYFYSSQTENYISFDWQTSMDVGVLGFNIYEKTKKGLRKLNQTLLPTYSISSLEPKMYHFQNDQMIGDTFILEEIDVYGRAHQRGPYRLNIPFGQIQQWDSFDWSSINIEHNQKKLERRTSSKSINFMSNNPNLFMPIVARNYVPTIPRPYSFTPYDLQISEDGIYRITFEYLKNSGIDFAGVDSHSIAIKVDNLSIPIMISNDGTFGPGSYIEFYGQSIDSLYTNKRIYTLEYDPASVARIPEVDASPIGTTAEKYYFETVSVDNNNAYGINAPGDDPWFDREIRAYDSPVSVNLDLVVDHYQPGTEPSTLVIGLWGQTDFPNIVDHHVLVSVNGTQVGESWFDGIRYQTIKATIPEGILNEGTNQLKITLPGDIGVETAIAFDQYSLTYPREFTARNGKLVFTSSGSGINVGGLPSADIVVYRLTDHVVRLSGINVEFINGSYQVSFKGTSQPAKYFIYSIEALQIPNSITSAKVIEDINHGTYDLLIISHPDFLNDLSELVNAKTSQGLKVKVVNIDDIYAIYNQKIIDPVAIRKFLTQAYSEMGVRYVLLVGGDSYDYLDYSGLGSISFIPSFYKPTHSLVRFSPVDALYADIDNDGIQDLAIGRLPVHTSAELKAVISKILAYQTKDYGNTLVFSTGAKDGQFSFATVSDQMINFITPGWLIEKAYIDNLGIGLAKLTLINSINNGTAFVNYIGHSSDTTWDNGLFTNQDAYNLINISRPTLINQLGCWNTYYVMPNHTTLADALLLEKESGAASVIGSISLTGQDVHNAFGFQLLPRLMQKGMYIGDAILLARQQVIWDMPAWINALNAYTLLGDPTLMINP